MLPSLAMILAGVLWVKVITRLIGQCGGTLGDQAMAKKSFSFQVNRDLSMTRYVMGMRTAKPASG